MELTALECSEIGEGSDSIISDSKSEINETIKDSIPLEDFSFNMEVKAIKRRKKSGDLPAHDGDLYQTIDTPVHKRKKQPKYTNLVHDESFYSVQHIPVLHSKFKVGDGKYTDPRGRCIVCCRNCPVLCRTCNHWVCLDRQDNSRRCWSMVHDSNWDVVKTYKCLRKSRILY